MLTTAGVARRAMVLKSGPGSPTARAAGAARLAARVVGSTRGAIRSPAKRPKRSAIEATRTGPSRPRLMGAFLAPAATAPAAGLAHGEEEHAVLDLGGHAVGIDGLRQREGARERAVSPLHPMEALRPRGTRGRPLAPDDQPAALRAHLQGLLEDARKL